MEVIDRSSKELQILLATLAPDPESRQATEVAGLLSGPVDWTYLLQLTSRHGVAPLVRQRLLRRTTVQVPEEVASSLKQDQMRTAVAALLWTKKLVQVLSVLNEHSIPAMPYKGVLLADMLYGDMGLRPTGDIDIIVQQQDVLRTIDCLTMDLDYAPSYALESPAHAAYVLENAKDYSLNQANHQIHLELHWDVAPPLMGYRVNWTDVWVRAEDVDWHGATAKIPAREDLLMLLVIHGGNHQWDSLRWLVDVAELIAQDPALDWASIAERAKEWHAERTLQLALLLCRELFNLTSIPDLQVEESIKKLSDHVIEVMDRPQSVSASERQRLSFLLTLQDRRIDRTRLHFKWIFGLNLQTMSRPQGKGLAAYFHRPRRLLGRRGLRDIPPLVKQAVRGIYS